jgi:tetratricopeptide (TPR) repeat protein
MRITFVLAFIFASVVSAYCQDAVDPLLLNGQYTEAITIIDTEILRADESRKSMLVNKKAEALIHLGNLDEGEKLLGEQLKTATSPFMRAVTLSTLGLLYINEGRYDKALESLQESSQLFQQSKNEESLEHAQAISYLGLVYQFTGKHTQAQEQMQVALNLRLKKLDSNHELIAASYNDLGLCFARVDNDKALDYYEKALTIYQKLHGKEHPKIAIASINTGYIYNELELYGDAVNNFETALKIWEKVHPGAHQTKAFALFNLGNTYAKMGDQKAAIGYYERALGMYRDTYGNKHPENCRCVECVG